MSIFFLVLSHILYLLTKCAPQFVRFPHNFYVTCKNRLVPLHYLMPSLIFSTVTNFDRNRNFHS